MVKLRAVVGRRLLYDEHVAGHGVDSQPELESQEVVTGEPSQEQELEPGQEMFRQHRVVPEDDQVVAEEESGRVGEHSEDVGEDVLTPGPDGSLRQREVEEERLHAGDLQVSVGVGVEVVGQRVTDLTEILTSHNSVEYEFSIELISCLTCSGGYRCPSFSQSGSNSIYSIVYTNEK